MILNTLWERYIFKSLIKTFVFFLLSFFLLYSLIDFSTHAQDFALNGKMQLTKLSTYYAYQFVKRLALLLPLALLISTIKVLSSLNAHRELVALQASGIKLVKILRPFFLLAFFCSLTSFANEEYLTPSFMAYFDQTKQTANTLAPKIQKKPFTVLYLNDSSKLVYQQFDPQKNAFFDVYWVRSFQDIWKMQYLNADPKKPFCEYVDHIIRNKEGQLEKVASYETLYLPDLKWDTTQLNKKQSAIKYQKITSLALSLVKNETTSFHLQGEIKTHFFYKLLIPFLSFLVLIGVVPFCVSYSRSSPLFLVYGVSIFCFVVFFTLLNAMVIIGENQTLPPYAAILSPFCLCLGIFYPKFHKLL